VGLIEYDETTRTYQKTGIKKRVFASKKEYEEAARHAKYLVISDPRKNTQG
jgi:hypothetical protein